jgi:aspartate racemase
MTDERRYRNGRGDTMKTIGLIGGMSWESTVTYYQVINETIKKQLGGLHSAKCILYSVDFDEIEKYQASGEWDKSADVLSEAAQALERAGADYIVICTNTMHKVAPEIGRRIHIPILHIADMTAAELQKQGIKKVGLLGTKYTMRQDFYKNILIEQGIEVVIPNDADVDVVNRIIYDELCLGKISEQSKDIYLDIIMKLAQDGAQGIILGCTEIGLLVRQSDTDIPLFDTTLIHAEQAALKSLEP